jgi:hypothetical protein
VCAQSAACSSVRARLPPRTVSFFEVNDDLYRPLAGRNGVTEAWRDTGGADEHGHDRGAGGGDPEIDARQGLEAGVSADDLSGSRVDQLGSHLAVGRDHDGVSALVVNAQCPARVVTGGHDDGSFQLHGHDRRVYLRDVVWRVRMLPQWLGSGVMKEADNELDIITEPPV